MGLAALVGILVVAGAALGTFLYDRAGTSINLISFLETHSDPASIPFVIEHDGSASIGHARARWVIDLSRWVLNTEIPQERRGQILGVLLGYSADEIGRYRDGEAGRRYITAIR